MDIGTGATGCKALGGESLSSAYESVPEPGRAVRRWGHWGSQVLIAALFVTIAIVVRPLPYDSAAMTLVPVLLVLTVVASWLLMRQHDRRLCEDCLRGLPLNPAQDAARFRRRLMLAHLAGDRRVVVSYLLLLLASNLALVPGSVPPVVGRALWAAVQSTMIYLMLAYGTHRRLQPWCPQCRGGGDDRQDADAPDPLPAGSSTD
jgi:hypothetical protein